MMAIVSLFWSYALVLLAGFCIGVFAGFWNGKRIAHVDGRFDELVRQANLYSREQAKKNTCVDATREEGKMP
jgi:hypothetical protein